MMTSVIDEKLGRTENAILSAVNNLTTVKNKKTYRGQKRKRKLFTPISLY